MEKASTTFNDMEGTASAEFNSDYHFQTFLEEKGVDTNRFIPFGAKLYWADRGNYFWFGIYCRDSEKGNNIRLNIPVRGFNEVSKLFHKMEVVVSNDNSAEIQQCIDFDNGEYTYTDI